MASTRPVASEIRSTRTSQMLLCRAGLLPTGLAAVAISVVPSGPISAPYTHVVHPWCWVHTTWLYCCSDPPALPVSSSRTASSCCPAA
jgi:hypothetical protein